MNAFSSYRLADDSASFHGEHRVHQDNIVTNAHDVFPWNDEAGTVIQTDKFQRSGNQ